MLLRVLIHRPVARGRLRLGLRTRVREGGCYLGIPRNGAFQGFRPSENTHTLQGPILDNAEQRSRWISTMVAGEMARGDCRGRHERSASSPRAARATHFRAVRSQMPKARATAATGSPASTRCAIRARLHGVVRAFLWTSIRDPSVEPVVIWRQPPSQKGLGWTMC